MKKRNSPTRNITLVGVLGLLVALSVGCQNPTSSNASKSDNSNLNSLSVNGISAILGNPGSSWSDANLTTGGVDLLETTDWTAPITVKVDPADSAATVLYGHATGSAKPTLSASSSFVIAKNDLVYVQVTSASGTTTKLYKVAVGLLSSDSTVTKIRVAGQTAALGTPQGTFNSTLVKGGVILSVSQAVGASVVVSASDPAATVQTAVLPDGSGDSPVFGNTSTFNLSNGDTLYVKVVSSDGTTSNIYGIVAAVDSNTDLATVSVNGNAVSTLPTGATSPTNAVAQLVYLSGNPGTNWVPIAATTVSSTAKVRFAKVTGNGSPVFGNSTSFLFSYGDNLYAEVTAGNGTTKSYYRMSILYQQTVQIPWGQPTVAATLSDADLATWNSAVTLNVTRAASSPVWPNPDSTAVAKLMWDFSGIYAMVTVTQPTTSAANTSSPWLEDSVELFLNEKWLATGNSGSYDDQGGQYRLGPNGDVSGSPSSAVSTFKSSNKYFGWTTPTGYVVVMQVPFVWAGRALANGTTIGLDIQVNRGASANGTTQTGLLAWNNLTGSNYENVANFGTAVLTGLSDSSEARLASVSVAGVTGKLAPSASWAGATNQVIRPVGASSATNFAVTARGISPKETIEYGTSASASTEPTNWSTSASLGSLSSGTYVGVKSVSADGKAINYYKFQVAYGSTDATLAANSKVTIYGLSVGLAAVAATYAAASPTPVCLTKAEAAPLTPAGSLVGATANDAHATVQFGFDTGSFSWSTYAWSYLGASSWLDSTSTGASTSLVVPQYGTAPRVVVRVTAADGVTSNYYVYSTTVSDVAATLVSPTVTPASDGTPVVVTAGSPSGAWNGPGLIDGSLTLTSAQAAAIGAFAGGAPSTATYKFAVVHSGTTGTAAVPVFGTTLPVGLANGDALYIQVDDQDSKSNGYVNVYKVDVTVAN